MVERKYHLVNWAKVCLGVRDGGLGVKNLSLVNRVLGKWLWRYMKDRNALWRRWL